MIDTDILQRLVVSIVTFLVDKGAFLRRQKTVKSILVCGNNGNGKKSIVTATFSAARKLREQVGIRMSFFRMRGTDILTDLIESSTRQLLLEIEDCAPSALLIEDAHVLFGTQTHCKNAVASFVNRLADLRDRKDSPKPIVIVLETTSLSDIDITVRHAVAQDRKSVRLSSPSRGHRKEIIHMYLQEAKLTISKDLISKIAEKTSGLSGGSLKWLVSELLELSIEKESSRTIVEAAIADRVLTVEEIKALEAQEAETADLEESEVLKMVDLFVFSHTSRTAAHKEAPKQEVKKTPKSDEKSSRLKRRREK